MSMMRDLMGVGQGGGMFAGPFGNFMNMIQKFNQFRQNPAGALMSMGFNVPQNIQGNPQAMVNYLRSSGQMSDEQFNQLSQAANQFGSMLGNSNR